MQKGYTLIEVLVAFTMFTILLGGALNLLVEGIQNQRRILGVQDVVGEISFVGETMIRALRQAQKDLGGTCLSQSGWNYEITESGAGVRFINRDGQCTEYYLDVAAERIREKISGDFLTSDDLRIIAFRVDETGAEQEDGLGNADHKQPRITLFIEIESKRAPGISGMKLQSTVTQRPLDTRRQ